MSQNIDAMDVDAPSFFKEKRPHNGLDYESYTAHWKEKLDRPLKGMDRIERRYHFYTKYNDERAGRVERAYEMSTRLMAKVDAIKEPQIWMVLTEDWCVDSAYALPVFYAAATRNSKINIRILTRDANLDIMDQYLTNEARSIPKLVIFSVDGEELGQWGPRPSTLHALRTDLKDSGEQGNIISQKSVEWYEAGGWQEVDTELANMLATIGK